MKTTGIKYEISLPFLYTFAHLGNETELWEIDFLHLNEWKQVTISKRLKNAVDYFGVCFQTVLMEGEVACVWGNRTLHQSHTPTALTFPAIIPLPV